MGLPEELKKHVEEPHKEKLKMEAERLDTAIKMFKDIIELADDDRMVYFLKVVQGKKERAEAILLAVSTPAPVREQAIGEIRALSAVLDWKKYYLTAIVEGKKALADTKKELKTGERPDDQPND